MKYTNEIQRPWKNKRVLIMGLGRFARGASNGAARFFVSAGANVTMTDDKPRAVLTDGIRHLRGLPVKLILGRYRKEDFRSADVIIRNQAIRGTHPLVAYARAHGVSVTTDVGLFFSIAPPVPSVGVTGTRGKSTTTALIGAMLEEAKYKTFIGGNIQISPLLFLKKVWNEYDCKHKMAVVFELSSFLLEGMSDVPSPTVAVITNLMRDHLNFHGSMAAYIKAKEEIFRNQRKDDVVILNYDNPLTRKMATHAPSHVVWFSRKEEPKGDAVFLRGKNIIVRHNEKEEKVASLSDIHFLKGDHNQENVLAAIAAANRCGAKKTAIVRTLRTFHGLPNRLQTIRTMQGVVYINDTTATTPDGAIAALKTISSDHSIVLIAGGTDKELDFRTMARAIREFTKGLILLEGTATKKLLKDLKKIGYACKTVPVVLSMREAVREARLLASRDDAVMLSPGAASFGLFKNEFDRGEQFVRIVRSLR